MAHWVAEGLVAFTAVLLVVDPFAAVPIFLAITRRDTPERRRRVAARASLWAFAVLVTFAVAGGLLFKAFGITLGAFKVAGGLMLFLMAADMMRAQPPRTRSTLEEQEESAGREDVAVVPLAIPLLAGPGAIATIMVLMGRAAWHPVRTGIVLGAVTVTCGCAWLILRWASLAERFLSKTVLNALERVMGLVLAAVAVEFIAGGARDLFPLALR